MAHYKSQIEGDIANLRMSMMNRLNEADGTHLCNDHIHKIQALQRECQSSRQEITYLKKRVAEATEEIKKMAIENNELSSQIKREQCNMDAEDIEAMKLQFGEKIIEQESVIAQMGEEMREMINKQSIANEVVNKNAQLIEALRAEREKFQQLESTYKIRMGELVQMSGQQPASHELEERHSNLEKEYQQLMIDYQTIVRENNTLKEDVSELGSILTDLKLRNQELASNSS